MIKLKWHRRIHPFKFHKSAYYCTRTSLLNISVSSHVGVRVKVSSQNLIQLFHSLNDSLVASTSAFGVKPFGQTGTSTFGQSNPTPQNPLFGNATQSFSSTPFGGFGAQPQTQPQGSAQGTSIFGSTLGQSTQQQPQPQQNQPLFGTNPAGQQFGQSTTGTGLFGQQPSANTQQFGSTLGSSIFGGNQNQTQQSAQPGLGQFGANNNNASTLGQSVFGSNPTPSQAQATQPAGTFGLGSSNLAGGALFGERPSQP